MNRLSINANPSVIDKLNSLNKFVEKNYDIESGSISLAMIRDLMPKLMSCLEIANQLAVDLLETEAALDDADGISK